MTPVVGKVGGILAANIAKVEGVAVASIKSLIGIDWPSLGYHYGYPAYGAFEPYVAAQWKFDDGWYNFTGITTGSGNYFATASPVPSADIGKGDYVITYTFSTTHGPGNLYIYSFDDLGAMRGYYGLIQPDSGFAYITTAYSDAGAAHGVNFLYTIPFSINTGQLHTVTIIGKRTGNEELFVDGISCGTNSLAAIYNSGAGEGYDIKAGVGVLGALTPGGVAAFDGTIYEWALATGVTTIGNRGPGSGVSPWTYLSDSTPGLVAHWKMQEPSGNITDSKNSVVLTANGTPTYSVSGATSNASIYDCTGALGDWSNFTGIYIPGIPTYGGFRASGPVPSIAFGTSDFVIEAVVRVDDTGGYHGICGDCNRATGQGWQWEATVNGRAYSKFYIMADDGTSVSANFAYPYNGPNVKGDGLFHKWRLVGDRSGNVELFIDKISQGTADISSLDGKTLSSWWPTAGDDSSNGNNPFDGTIMEVRLTVGNITNNSLGPNEMPPPYVYGSDADPGVVAHWKMQEASGSIVDTISGITLDPMYGPMTYSIAGPSRRPAIRLDNVDPTYHFVYNVTATGVWAGVSPGITVQNHAAFWLNEHIPQLDIAANEHFVIESDIICPSTSWPYSNIVLSWIVSTGGVCTVDFVNPTLCLIDFYWEPSGENYAYIAIPAINDDLMHKVRVTADRAGDCVLYIDGLEQGRFAISGSSDKTMTCLRLTLGAYANPVAARDGDYYELRISKSTDPAVLLNNSGGPNGG